MASHPELAVVTRRGADDGLMLSLVSQLLEHGVHFEHGPRQELLPDLPPDLEAYKAVLLDQPAFDAVVSDRDGRRRLEELAAGPGFVFRVSDPAEGATKGFHARTMFDMVTRNLVQDTLMHAPLSRYTDDAYAGQLNRPDQEILTGLEEQVSSTVRRMRGWNEMTLHFWKAAKGLIELGGREALRDDLIAAIREASEDIPPALNHDKVGGYFATVWLWEQTGDRRPLDRARARLDEMIAKRPRHQGILTGTGFEDDPLAIGANDGPFGFFFSDTTVRRRALWNEGLHLYSQAFAAMGRATGERHYLEEMLRYVAYIRRVHQRDDGLIEHASGDGKSNEIVWARGMLHALLGMLYLLDEMAPGDPAFQDALAPIEAAGRGLMLHQDRVTGLWRNVIDHPDARLESSSTAGFAYIYARGIREGWLDRTTFEPMVRAAWQGLKRLYWRGGFAANCRGSGASVDLHYYLGRPQGYSAQPPTCWATMAAVELKKLDEEVRKRPCTEGDCSRP